MTPQSIWDLSCQLFQIGPYLTVHGPAERAPAAVRPTPSNLPHASARPSGRWRTQPVAGIRRCGRPRAQMLNKGGWSRPLGLLVKISQPSSVMPIECSNCAESERSRVTAVQPSSSSFTSGRPMLIIGSTVKNMPGRSSGPVPAAADMDDFGRVVEDLAEAVPAEIADHAVAMLLGMVLDGMGDVAEMVAGPRLLERRASGTHTSRRPGGAP